MVSRSMRDWQHAMAYGLTNCYNIHHLKQVQNHFDPERGWFKTIGNITVTSNDIASRWLAPGQLIDPGLWMKVPPVLLGCHLWR